MADNPADATDHAVNLAADLEADMADVSEHTSNIAADATDAADRMTESAVVRLPGMASHSLAAFSSAARCFESGWCSAARRSALGVIKRMAIRRH